MFTLPALVSLLAIARVATAHGTVKGVQIGSTKYPGAVLLNADPSKSPVRPITNQGEPIFDVNSNAMICGTGASPAPVTAPVKAGSTVQVFWQGESVANWFHNTGPILTYLASCNGDCSKFNPTASTSWFKISEQGESNGPGTWAQAKLLDGSPSSVTIPSDLPSGNYLMRHEIIALQNGMTEGKAEFYPACIQFQVTGGPSGRVAASPTVNFPGTYKATDPGILFDAFTPGKTYTFPGGAISSIAAGSGSSSGSGSDDSGSDDSGSSSSTAPASSAPINVGGNPNAPTSTSTSSAPPSKSTGKCKSKKAKRDAVNATTAATRKRNALSAHRKRRLLFAESQ